MPVIRTPKRKRWLEPRAFADGWDIPVEVVSESNKREHWTKQNKRKREQQEGVRVSIWLEPWLANKWRRQIQAAPCQITFIRCGGRTMDKSNLPVAFKGVEDALAHLLGIDDGHPHWLPKFEQEPGGPVGIKIRMEVC